MSLISCPECNNQVSDRAKQCPHCGYPLEINEKKEGCGLSNTETAVEYEEMTSGGPVSFPVEGDEHIKFYQKTWFAFLVLFLCFPVGCFLIWKYKKANILVRIIATLCSGWFFGAVVPAGFTLLMSLLCSVVGCIVVWKNKRAKASAKIIVSVWLGMNLLFWGGVAFFLSLPCEHSWQNDTGTSQKVCEICGETEENAEGDVWVGTTYETPADIETEQAVLPDEPIETDAPLGTVLPDETSDATKSPEKLCHYVKGCTSSISEFVTYCYLHECADSACKNARKDDDSFYCHEHNCSARGCNNKRGLVTDYCSSHECIDVGCKEERVDGGDYCYEHTCAARGCMSKASMYSGYCSSHECRASSCENPRIDRGNYCAEHTCAQKGCNRQAGRKSDYCSSHD